MLERRSYRWVPNHALLEQGISKVISSVFLGTFLAFPVPRFN